MTSSLPSGVGASASGPGETGEVAAEEPRHSAGESFWSVAYRRTRYTIGIAAAALLFSTLGWKAASPQPEWGGVSLVIWQNHGLWAAFGLTLMLLAAIAVCSILVHPDSPHMGMFCALLGMAGLSIRGGDIHMLMEYAQIKGKMMEVSNGLAIECLLWGVMVLIGEVFARLLHDQFFANTHWITRSSPDLVIQAMRKERGLPGMAEGVLGGTHTMAKTLRTAKLRRRFAAPLALIVNGAIAMVLLRVFLQSEAKGQVLIGCFISFALSTVLAYLLFSQSPIQAFLLTVPVVAAVGYWYGGRMTGLYPGHAAFFVARALPIDYMCAGIPGAIVGYYGGFRWSLQAHEEE